MSKHNKANKNNYIQGGRLAQDDMARERVNQAQVSARAKSKENVIGKTSSHPAEQDSNHRKTSSGE
jgi:hypothetical protein